MIGLTSNIVTITVNESARYTQVRSASHTTA